MWVQIPIIFHFKLNYYLVQYLIIFPYVHEISQSWVCSCLFAQLHWITTIYSSSTYVLFYTTCLLGKFSINSKIFISLQVHHLAFCIMAVWFVSISSIIKVILCFSIWHQLWMQLCGCFCPILWNQPTCCHFPHSSLENIILFLCFLMCSKAFLLVSPSFPESFLLVLNYPFYALC